jgi:hypothetical protein
MMRWRIRLVEYYATATSTMSDSAPAQSEFNGKGNRKREPVAKAIRIGMPYKRRFPDLEA